MKRNKTTKRKDKKNDPAKQYRLYVRRLFSDLILLQIGFDPNPVPYKFQNGECRCMPMQRGTAPLRTLETMSLPWVLYTFVAYENVHGIQVDVWQYSYPDCSKQKIESKIADALHTHIGSINRRIRFNFGSILTLQQAELTEHQLMQMFNAAPDFWDTEDKGCINTEEETLQDSHNLMVSLEALIKREKKHDS